MPSRKPLTVKDIAINYGIRLTTNYFAGRKGHGGADVGYVTLDKHKLAAMLALAYEAGHDTGTRQGSTAALSRTLNEAEAVYRP